MSPVAFAFVACFIGCLAAICCLVAMGTIAGYVFASLVFVVAAVLASFMVAGSK